MTKYLVEWEKGEIWKTQEHLFCRKIFEYPNIQLYSLCFFHDVSVKNILLFIIIVLIVLLYVILVIIN